jgi:hypothetical protein
MGRRDFCFWVLAFIQHAIVVIQQAGVVKRIKIIHQIVQIVHSSATIRKPSLHYKNVIDMSKTAIVILSDANTSSYNLVTDNKVPGTAGLPSFLKLRKEGYNVLIF